jgi:hypothetical protein
MDVICILTSKKSNPIRVPEYAVAMAVARQRANEARAMQVIVAFKTWKNNVMNIFILDFESLHLMVYICLKLFGALADRLRCGQNGLVTPRRLA